MWCKNDELANIKHTVNHQCELDYLAAFKIVCKEKERKGEKEGGLAATVQHGSRESNSSSSRNSNSKALRIPELHEMKPFRGGDGKGDGLQGGKGGGSRWMGGWRD